ncbi:MAG: MBL fold metallo-hydrolase [Terriglobia bacterium]
MKLLNLDFERIAHDTFRIAGSRLLYTDPFRVKNPDQPDLILLSHDHSDHMSPEDLAKLVTPKTHIVASPLCTEGLKDVKAGKVEYLTPGEKTAVEGIEIEAVAAYNLNKFRSPGNPFHPKEAHGAGFIFKMDGTTVYYAGDTDYIPEMKTFRCDIALLPVSGTYVMTAEEAAQAAADINPRIAVPMHYNAIVGTNADAQKFKSLVKNCQVEIV